jgi:O-antigen/teichoic acid export membrane protein
MGRAHADRLWSRESIVNFKDKSLIYIGSHIAGSAFPLLTSMVMVRYLSQYEYGTFRQIMLLAVLLPTCIALALPQSLAYFIPRAAAAKEKKQLALQMFICLTALGAVAAVCVHGLREEVSGSFSNPDLLSFSIIFSLYMLFIVPNKCAQAALLALGRINLATVLDVATDVCNFLFVAVPLVLGYGLHVVLWSLLAFYAVKFLFVLIILLCLDGGFPNLLDRGMLRAQILYSLPLWLSFLVGATRAYVDKFLVVFLYRPEDFAVYSRGAFELPLVGLVPFALSGLVAPRFAASYARGAVSEITALWREMARNVAQLFFPLFVFCFIFAEPIITLLFTAQYSGGADIFRIYLCLLPLRIVSYKTILIATGTTKPILSAAVLGFIASVVLGISLETVLGLIGPAIGNVIGEAVGMGYMLWHSKRILNVSWAALVPTQGLLQSFGGAALVGMIVFPLRSMAFDYPIWVVGYAVAYFSAYVAFMKVFRFFSEEDWALICRCATLKVLRDLR